ncbi:hypothetical protein MTX20_36475 [Bradyrhizobium sp. ISRA435]|nr:hypothetical protein MTX20_36475 [Bradyrhizobium sp. ISRA435]
MIDLTRFALLRLRHRRDGQAVPDVKSGSFADDAELVFKTLKLFADPIEMPMGDVFAAWHWIKVPFKSRLYDHPLTCARVLHCGLKLFEQLLGKLDAYLSCHCEPH